MAVRAELSSSADVTRTDRPVGSRQVLQPVRHRHQRHRAPVREVQAPLEVVYRAVGGLVRSDESTVVVRLERHPEPQRAIGRLLLAAVDAAERGRHGHRGADAPRVVAHAVPAVDRDLLALHVRRAGDPADRRVADRVVDHRAVLEVLVALLGERRRDGVHHHVELDARGVLLARQADRAHRLDDLQADRADGRLVVARSQCPRGAHRPLALVARDRRPPVDDVDVRVQPQAGEEVPVLGVEREEVAVVEVGVRRRDRVERRGRLVERQLVDAVEPHERYLGGRFRVRGVTAS